jgi:hypothetical protein
MKESTKSGMCTAMKAMRDCRRSKNRRWAVAGSETPNAAPETKRRETPPHPLPKANGRSNKSGELLRVPMLAMPSLPLSTPIHMIETAAHHLPMALPAHFVPIKAAILQKAFISEPNASRVSFIHLHSSADITAKHCHRRYTFVPTRKMAIAPHVRQLGAHRTELLKTNAHNSPTESATMASQNSTSHLPDSPTHAPSTKLHIMQPFFLTRNATHGLHIE